MEAKIDYDAIRAQTLGTGNDEAVTVNTRALIDKVLARYSGEWTTLRELLQNAADAASEQVKINLKTLPSSTIPVPQSTDSATRLRHVLLNHTMKSMNVENDGDKFRSTDWARLKKIAEGNPDETKIGAFGVGFYSVFAECEEPLVSSGNEALAFYWKGDALYTKSARLLNGQISNTTFILPNRNRDSPVPNLLSLCRFLVSSLTFVGLERIELWLDEWKIMTLNKKNAPSLEVHIPEEVTRKTKEGLMHVNSVVREAAQLDAQWLKVVEWKPTATTISPSNSAVKPQASQSLRSFFHRLAPGTSNTAALEKQAREERESQSKIVEDVLGVTNATLFVHVAKASIKTMIDQSFSTELERATKKPPPKNTTISLLSASYDERVASTASFTEESGAPKIFDSFIPSNGKGRIFIGFTTTQTTGLNVHISTPSVIPTVERESIDLNNRFVRSWNVELLRVAGIISRISWGGEMSVIQDKLLRSVKSAGRRNVLKEDISAVLPEALFLHNAYSWTDTTPSPEVGTLMEEAFWTCNQKVAIATLSTQGVLPASKVRLEPEDLSFIDSIPSLPGALASVGLVKKLIDYGVITEITVPDIKSELENKPLSGAQLRQFLGWLLQKVRVDEVDLATAQSLLGVTIANDDEEGGHGKLIVLNEISCFLNPQKISVEMPLPPYVLPFKYTKEISKPVLELLFNDLQLVPWLRWLIENTGGRGALTAEQDIQTSTLFAASVLAVISKQWEGLSQSSKATVVELLTSRTTMPTKLGMRKPAEAYFPTVKLFDDLPVVSGLTGVKDKLLSALGVRKTIEIGVVFERLMDSSATKSQIPNSAAKWSHVDLIKYLASVRADIPPQDIKRLRSTKICPKETESLQASNERHLVSELYQPEQSLRRLKLPTLQWPGTYRSDSAEGRFLTFLGLRAHPNYEDLIQLIAKAASDSDPKLHFESLKYFIDHHQTKGYASYNHASVTLAYLPIEGSGKFAKPTDLFSNERAAVLGFDILRRDLQIHALKFGVKQEPPISLCIDRLVAKPPRSKRDAREMFGYMVGRVADLTSQSTEALSKAKIIPVLSKISKPQGSLTDKVGESLTYIAPAACFLGHGDSKYADIFDYVDFGQEANSFLLRIGSKHEPSINELAGRLVREPAKLFSVLGDARFLELLRSIADSWALLKKDKTLVNEMKASKCLLAYKEIGTKSSDKDEEEHESSVKTWDLARAKDIVVIDDIITYNRFKDVLLATPMEETLEALYYSLGSREVGSLLEEHQSLGSAERDQSSAAQLQGLLTERARLFLHDYRPDAIKQDHSWLQKNLKVQCVQSISTTFSLQGYPGVRRKEKKRAVLLNDKPILHITRAYDMFEVSQAVAPLLLRRVKPQSILMFEMMLESSLNKLGRRGYNVQRILNEKAREAKIAEERLKQQEAEATEQMRENEAAWARTQSENAARDNELRDMPGVFPDSPDRKTNMPPEEIQPPKPKGFLNGIGKRFNFEQMRQNLSQNGSTTQSNNPAPEALEDAPPPPYSQAAGGAPRPPAPAETVTAPHQVQQNLMNIIKDSRPHHSTSINSHTTYNDVKETSTYCDAKPGHSLRQIGEISGIRLFIDKGLEERGVTTEDFLNKNASALKLFASVLQDCADSYALPRNTVHIFYDDRGTSIAFNSNKALFFNYRYFENLHLLPARQGKKAEGIVYWAVTMAHELAHNVAADHSSKHSYYTESLVIQYFGKIASKLGYSSDGLLSNVSTHPLRPEGSGAGSLIDVD